MWARLKRLFRAIFGGLISSAEDPELILEQLIRDMNDEVPKLRTNVAEVMSTEKRLEREIERDQAKVADLNSKIQAAIRLGKDDIATAMITEMNLAQKSLQTTQGNHAQAKVASQKAREYLDNYMAQVRRRQAEAMQLISASKQAAMQEKMAATMAAFQVGDATHTFDDMREKIDQRAASAEARMELGMNTFDAMMQSFESDVAHLEAVDQLAAYKAQMGIGVESNHDTVLGEGAPAHRALNAVSDEAGVDLETPHVRERELVRN